MLIQAVLNKKSKHIQKTSKRLQNFSKKEKRKELRAVLNFQKKSVDVALKTRQIA